GWRANPSLRAAASLTYRARGDARWTAQAPSGGAAGGGRGQRGRTQVPGGPAGREARRGEDRVGSDGKTEGGPNQGGGCRGGLTEAGHRGFSLSPGMR